MSRRSYASVLDKALKPFGFERKGLNWHRVRGEIQHCVNQQPSWLGGRTVNLWMKNLETEKLFLKIFGPTGAIQMPPPIDVRLGHLIDRYDRWWYDEPNGPEDMAENTVRYGLPWFETVRSLEDQIDRWYGGRDVQTRRGYFGPGLIGLALTLYRMGEREEACKVLRKRVPKTAIKTSVEDVARVRAWMGCEAPYQ